MKKNVYVLFQWVEGGPGKELSRHDTREEATEQANSYFPARAYTIKRKVVDIEESVSFTTKEKRLARRLLKKDFNHMGTRMFAIEQKNDATEEEKKSAWGLYQKLLADSDILRELLKKLED